MRHGYGLVRSICLAVLFGCFFVILMLPRAVAQESEDNVLDGFDTGITYTADIFSNTRGGAGTGIRYMDNLDLEIRFDTDKALGWSSTEFYIYGLANQGGSISGLAGDIQGVSNIEAETSWRIYEAWFQKYIYEFRISLLAGLYDLNSEFDVINTATLLINSSHGIGPEYAQSGVMGPSIFPYTSAGIRVKSNPFKGLVVKAAVLDGIPSNPQNSDGTKIFFRERDGLLLAGELTLYPHREETMSSRTRMGRIRQYLTRGVGVGDNRYKVAVGGWMYTKTRIGWVGDPSRSRGFYALAEYRLLAEAGDAFQGLSAFIRYGLANGEVNRLDRYVGGGLVYTGLIGNRERDQLGLAVATTFNSNAYEVSGVPSGMVTTSYEMNVEATYRLKVENFSFVQLDMQYIVNPGLLAVRKNALVVGTRLQIAL